MADEGGVPRKRNRNLLRQFYGVKNEQEEGEASTDLNNENFDTDLYMKVDNFLRLKSLIFEIYLDLNIHCCFSTNIKIFNTPFPSATTD